MNRHEDSENNSRRHEFKRDVPLSVRVRTRVQHAMSFVAPGFLSKASVHIVVRFVQEANEILSGRQVLETQGSIQKFLKVNATFRARQTFAKQVQKVSPFLHLGFRQGFWAPVGKGVQRIPCARAPLVDGDSHAKTSLKLHECKWSCDKASLFFYAPLLSNKLDVSSKLRHPNLDIWRRVWT